ncbi:TetM/TetW/TetO/TetS family tetracycline resistance ribosomal protection protein [Actinomadura litoris]|uniref:GTP-binding protein n=1 Tax=Actinomadura litoris TaxID=2678616 RepID=A0A7K1KX72_9ACTN|nr:TetM/TetW/TetO/TetS family tetracycline resistance ribosomal protection protein [Actinomadura litoris]MUN36808.1 GTP-binding protein [Actinomadura litoris]
MKRLNLGILAHVDAGKTSLTERLLHHAGVIDEIGRVDDGSTQTDTLALERRRGITIRSAVVSFTVGGTSVNLIDTPGHPDFIAEVERALGVLDGALLVVSAVEGVQPQTRVLWRALRRLGVPALVFVNKIDRRGADPEGVLRGVSERLTPAVVPMGAVSGAGSRDARFTPFAAGDPGFTARLLDLLSRQDDDLLADYVEDEAAVGSGRLRAALAAQTARAAAHPLYFGSAMTGAGVPALLDGITGLLPGAGGDAEGPPSGTVFKVERGQGGEKIAYVRMYSGTVRPRDRIGFGAADGAEEKVTDVGVVDHGAEVLRAPVTAGRIGKLWGLGRVRVGDHIGERPAASPDRLGRQRHFPPPTLETVVAPVRRADRGALHAALTRLAEQDPLINLREDGPGEMSLLLYGEVQKEVLQATLLDEFGVRVAFRESTTICVERPVGAGAADEAIGVDPNPFLATVGLRVRPAPPGTGVRFGLEVELGAMPPTFFRAVEESVTETLRQGLRGWQVVDCAVSMTHCGYWARQSHSHGTFDKSMSSTAGDFRNLTPLVLMSALKQAGTRVHEPLHGFSIETPASTVRALLPVLAQLRAVPRDHRTRGGTCLLDGTIPAARVHELQRRLPGLTHGEGVLESAFERYEPVRGEPPSRPRSGVDPLDREEYLLHVVRRV